MKLHTDCLDDPIVLVTAPTGTVAHNINGDTVHHALSLPVQKGTYFEYRPLTHANRQQMFNKLQHVKFLIIDKVSMIGMNILQYIHLRLNEIFECSECDVYFGGLNVLLFGDMYQS
jgi:hypothetical protein